MNRANSKVTHNIGLQIAMCICYMISTEKKLFGSLMRTCATNYKIHSLYKLKFIVQAELTQSFVVAEKLYDLL